MIRINPDVKTQTHKYIQTSNADSKFGLNIWDENTEKIIGKIIEDENINLLGFHAHIGSQVKNLDFFKEETKIMTAFTKNIQEKFMVNFSHLNLGGGFWWLRTWIGEFPQRFDYFYGRFVWKK